MISFCDHVGIFRVTRTRNDSFLRNIRHKKGFEKTVSVEIRSQIIKNLTALVFQLVSLSCRKYLPVLTPCCEFVYRCNHCKYPPFLIPPPLLRSNFVNLKNVKFFLFSILHYKIRKIATAL